MSPTLFGTPTAFLGGLNCSSFQAATNQSLTQDVVDPPMKPSRTKILFPTDYSGLNEVALRQAIDLARSSSARLLVLHVVPPDFPYVGVEPPSPDQTKSLEGFKLSSVIESACGGNGVKCEHRVLMGRDSSGGQERRRVADRHEHDRANWSSPADVGKRGGNGSAQSALPCAYALTDIGRTRAAA
jgi:nucleotide-binding universal stress UspA family protein